MAQQPNFPPPGQQNPITQTNYPPPSGDKKPHNSYAQTGQNMPQQKMEQPIFPPLGQQNPPTNQNNFLPTGKQNPNQFYAQPGQNVPQQNPQYQQPQMGQPQYQPQMNQPMDQPMPQQYYQQQGPYYQQQSPYYQQPVRQIPRQQFPVPNPPMPAGGFAMQTVPLQPWSTELFDCSHDMENTIITFFCPCITFGQIADITDRGMTTCSSAGVIYALILSCTGLQWIYSWMYRTRLRTQYSLVEDPCHDCLVHFFCEYCALCQEYRELKNRGFNMELGWTGNMQMQAQMGAAEQRVPPPVQGMTR